MAGHLQIQVRPQRRMVNMTNSRLTDPEVLEFRFPVRLESYEIRAGSGRAGRWHGGVRRVKFLAPMAPMAASILSNGCVHLAIGLAGAPSLNRVLRAGGRVEVLGHIAQTEMQPGDMFEIHAPGGMGGRNEAIDLG